MSSLRYHSIGRLCSAQAFELYSGDILFTLLIVVTATILTALISIALAGALTLSETPWLIAGLPLLLVGGGSGVAPLMSILRHRAAIGGEVAVVLLQAARTWDDVIYREELIARDAAEAEFTLLLSLSRDAARRPQDAGRRIDLPLLEGTLAMLGAAPRLTFVCGSNPFVEAVTVHLLNLGLSPQAIRTERFGG